MHLWVTVCRNQFWGHFDLDLISRIIVPILFEVEIPNLVYGCGVSHAIFESNSDHIS